MLNKIKYPLLLVFCLLAIVSCKCKDVPNTNKESIDKIDKDMITEKLYNSNKTMVLVISFKNDISARKTLNYKVLDSKSKALIQQGTFEGMKLVWNNNTSLKGFLYQGMVTKDGETNNSDNYKIIEIEK